MGKYDRRSRDQKRKAKLKKRQERSGKHESQAYHGNKYKSEECVPALFSAETGIFESYVLLDHALTDDTVEEAVETLIGQLREGPLPPPVAQPTITRGPDGEVELILWNIQHNWEELAEEGPLPRRDDLIGVLRTILGSLETWRSESLHSQGYLRYLEGFLKKAGVSVVVETDDTDEDFAPEEDPLLDVGREWIEDGDEAARVEFAETVEKLIRTGDAARVIDVCQQLIGEHGDSRLVPVLQLLAFRGREALRTQMG